MKEIFSLSSEGHEGRSSSPLISCLLHTIFIKTVHEIQSMFSNLLGFISNFHYEKRDKCVIYEERYILRSFLQDNGNLKIFPPTARSHGQVGFHALMAIYTGC